jgi:hypothetical protein
VNRKKAQKAQKMERLRRAKATKIGIRIVRPVNNRLRFVDSFFLPLAPFCGYSDFCLPFTSLREFFSYSPGGG